MVSESLRNLLVAEMTIAPPVAVTILAPDETGGDRRINLFLYRVVESPALKNNDWQVKRGESTRIVPPPLSLNLYYLMTPYAQNDPLTGNATAHEMLGEAIRAATRGDSLISPSITRRLLSSFARSGRGESPTQPVDPLTEREEQVLLTIARVRTNAEIAVELHISLSTAKAHISTVDDAVTAIPRRATA